MSSTGLDTQNLTRNCHEALILAILEDGARHGYQLALEVEERSDGAFRFNHGTLYPILHRLERDGMIRGEWDENSPRRKRKRYSLTAAGGRRLERHREDWKRFCRVLGDFIDREGP